jgi:hypothetical protein
LIGIEIVTVGEEGKSITGDGPVRTGARRSVSKHPKSLFYSTTPYLIRICDNLVGRAMRQDKLKRAIDKETVAVRFHNDKTYQRS